MSTTVNSQITDAVTQTNAKVLGDAPARAMGSLYQAAAHSTGILFENAVAAQQQLNTLAQAATAQGVMQIYSVDTLSDSGSTAKLAQIGTDTREASAKLAASLPANGISSEIKDAVHEVLHDVIGSAGEFGYALRNTADAHAAALRRINEVSYAAMFDVLRLAATSACLAAMLREPDKAGDYRNVLDLLEYLGKR